MSTNPKEDEEINLGNRVLQGYLKDNPIKVKKLYNQTRKNIINSQ